MFGLLLFGRGDKIRTCDSIVPNDVRYQTALHLDLKTAPNLSGLMAAELGFEPRQTESESVVLPLHNSAPTT